MNEVGVGPEEPLFYAVIIGFLFYFSWILVQWWRWKVRQRKYGAYLEDVLKQTDSQRYALEGQLVAVLSDRHGSTTVASALKGELRRHMSISLLKIALGNPYEISFIGSGQQTWQYKWGANEVLYVLVERQRVINWQTVKLKNA